MIQTPVQPVPQLPQQCQAIVQPSYNAVKIDIHNPQVNAPGYSQSPIQVPNYTNQVYSYPKTQIYDVPQQSVYKPKEETAVNQPNPVKEVPVVPPPVIVPVDKTAEVAQVQPQAATVPAPVAATAPIAAVNPVSPAIAPAVANTATTPDTSIKVSDAEVKHQTVDVVAPEKIEPKVEVNEFIAKLTNPDYETQATTMETIADMAQNSPDKATDLLDVKVVDTLLGIMQKDTTKLEGPSAKQLEIRDKIINGKPVTDEETAEANKMTPMEQAERNKQYAMYTIASLQKLYISEIEKMNNAIVPIVELPGAAGIVEQIKNNPNPMVRAAGIDALSYIQRPEYKQDLTTIFTIAQKDQDSSVQKAATKALDKISKLADSTPAPADVPAPVATAEPAKTESAQKTAEAPKTEEPKAAAEVKQQEEKKTV